MVQPESGERGVGRSWKALRLPEECLWGSHRITFLSLPPLHSDLPSCVGEGGVTSHRPGASPSPPVPGEGVSYVTSPSCVFR